MKTLGTHNYYVYIITNIRRSVLYTGMTNSIENRTGQHTINALNNKKTFAANYNCYFAVYVEHFSQVTDAIAREKQIKGWTRVKKEALINSVNPDWKFLEV